MIGFKLSRGEWLLLAASTVLAIVLARPYAGGWNDASRLATAESVVDRGTMAIDDSIFVRVPQHQGLPLPYPVDRADLLTHGTLDKLYISGSFYSDKTPLPSLYLAGIYRVWTWCGGPMASDRADLFCLVLTWSSSGLAFVFAIMGILTIGQTIGLNPLWRLTLGCSFSLGTVTLGYVGTVNGHIIQLAAAVFVFALLLRLSSSERPVQTLVMIGTLLGIAYAADASAGPTLGLCTTIGVFAMSGRPMSIFIVSLGSLPFVISHHAVNYSIGGTIAPANANPEYFLWEGSPFKTGNITGRWRHESMNHFVLYIGDLLFGKQGFLFHNWPAFLASLWSIPMIRLARRERSVLLIGLIWSVSTLVLAAASSTNRSGQCLSVRWFLPLLAPAFVTLAVLIRERIDLRVDFVAVSICGLAISLPSAYYGLWIAHLIPGYWLIAAVSIISLVVVRYKAMRRVVITDGIIPAGISRPTFTIR